MPHPPIFADDDPYLGRLRPLALAFPDAVEAVAHGHQQVVPHIMAVRVVDRLEPIQVHQVDRNQSLGRAVGERGVQRVLETAPVAQTGERIGVGQ